MQSNRTMVLGQAMSAAVVALAVTVAAVPSLAGDPAFLPGTDPGGIAIALVGPGIDYTDLDISKRLARDGEGTPIGWDFIDNNLKPYVRAEDDADAGGMETARALLKAYKKSRLIVVRANTTDDAATARALAMASKMPARIIAAPRLPEANGSKIILMLAEQAPQKLFVVPASPGWGDVVPDNVVRVASFADWASMKGLGVDVWMTEPGAGLFGDLIVRRPAQSQSGGGMSVARAAANAACAQHGAPLDSGRAARDAFLQLARPSKSRPGVMVHDPLCLYGGKVLNR